MRRLTIDVNYLDADPKIGREAFVYLSPKEPVDRFAQCETCLNFIPARGRCRLFTDRDDVRPSGTCGLYAHGEPSDDADPEGATDKTQAGYLVAEVRCQNCSWFDHGCDLYRTLNDRLGQVFDLDENVDEHGCCNAWQG